MSTTREFAPVRTKDKKRTTPTPARVLAAHAVEAALDKKAVDLVVLDMHEVSGVADYFVVCTGDSDLKLKAICDAVEDRIKDTCNERPWHREGYEHRQWILLDYVDVVVHLFSPEKRAFYDLERLWGDAPIEHVPEDATSATDVALLQESSTS
ncbi:MAG: ribosome silencing factor [Rhodothermales bacterium]